MEQKVLIFVGCIALIINVAYGSPGQGPSSRGGRIRSTNFSKSLIGGGWFSSWFSSSKPPPPSSKILPKGLAPDFSAKNALKPIGLPVYPGLERSQVNPNKSPSPYNNHLCNDVVPSTHLGPSPGYSPKQPLPGVLSQPPAVVPIHLSRNSEGNGSKSFLGTEQTTAEAFVNLALNSALKSANLPVEPVLNLTSPTLNTSTATPMAKLYLSSIPNSEPSRHNNTGVPFSNATEAPEMFKNATLASMFRRNCGNPCTSTKGTAAHPLALLIVLVISYVKFSNL
jgi:hypothetical protein